MAFHSRSMCGLILATVIYSMIDNAASFRSHQNAILTDAYLRGIMDRLGDKILPDSPVPDGYVDYQNYDDVLGTSSMNDPIESEIKEYEEAPDNINEPRERSGLGLSLRDQEYLKHSSLLASTALHQHEQPGSEKAGPASTPSESSSTSSSGKAENVLPAYCNPPNPCPIGYTAEDGCLEEFENTAAFSREYQAAQDCMCDTEHMFDCPASSLGNSAKSRASAKNRAAANMVDSAIRKIMSDLQEDHKSLVSKKFFDKKKFMDELTSLRERAENAAHLAPAHSPSDNPYLQGDKLPIAAKKGNRVA